MLCIWMVALKWCNGRVITLIRFPATRVSIKAPCPDIFSQFTKFLRPPGLEEFCFHVLLLDIFWQNIYIASVNNLRTSHRHGPLTILMPVISIIILSLFQHHHPKNQLTCCLSWQFTIHWNADKDKFLSTWRTTVDDIVNNIHPGQKQDLIHNITTFMLFRLCSIRFTGSENERQITLWCER